MNQDKSILVDFVRTGSEESFRNLVHQYTDLVYSTALRLMNGNTASAQDVTQTVFTDLARMASHLPKNVQLGGWLHRHTCFVASKARRGERRRRAREQQAVQMNAQQDGVDPNFEQIASTLDEAINSLREKDRAAVVLRFIERQNLNAVGTSLGISENAAQKRIGRALELLRKIFRKRGFIISATTLTALLGQATVGAPLGLTNTIGVAALTAFHAGKALTLFEILLMNKFKVATVCLIMAAAITTPVAVQRKELVRLRDENRQMRQIEPELVALRTENQQLSNSLAQASSLSSLSKAQSAELLKLRGEIATLRNANTELKHQPQKSESTSAPAPASPGFYFVGGAGISIPGRHLFQQGLTVKRAIDACGGLTRPPEDLTAELTHQTDTNKTRLDLVAIFSGTILDPEILPEDKLSLLISNP